MWLDCNISRFGPRRSSGSGLPTGLDSNRTIFALPTRTLGALPGSVANTTQKLLLHSPSIYCTQMWWVSGMISWLALVFSTLQAYPRCSTEVDQWNSWPLYNSTFWSILNMVSMRTFWSYAVTSPLPLWPQFSSIWAWNRCSIWGITKPTDASLGEVNWMLLLPP